MSFARLFLTALLLLPSLAQAQKHVIIPEPNGIRLQANLFLPTTSAQNPGIVALHGCGGPMPSRDDTWARLLAA
jgi:dienelactone hydrolase